MEREIRKVWKAYKPFFKKDEEPVQEFLNEFFGNAKVTLDFKEEWNDRVRLQKIKNNRI